MESKGRLGSMVRFSCAVASVLGCGLAGCGPAVTALDASANDAATLTDAPDATVQRGPVALSLDADPDGLWWEPTNSTLYIADNVNNRILAWRDDGSVRVVATLPMAAPVVGGRGLGQLVRLPDGTLVVTRLGQGTTGDVVVVAPDGSATVVPNLDPMRRRVGVARAADGTLYDAYFVRTSSGHVGAVARLDLAGSEQDAITALDKPIGVLVSGSAWIVSDQGRDELLTADLADPTSVRQLAIVPMPDLLCTGPAGTLFVSSQTGVVERVGTDGVVSPFVSGLQTPRGVAYDGNARRLFVADHDPNAADGVTNYLRIVPVD